MIAPRLHFRPRPHDSSSTRIESMKTKPTRTENRPEFSDDDIRAYAQHLFEQSGCAPGRDLDNWLEAKACLEASVPQLESHRRLQEHLNNGRTKKVA